MLPSRLTAQDGATIASEFLAAHNASMTWYLNRRLSGVSQSQKEMQEERIKRQLERTRTLGSTPNEVRPGNPFDPLSAPSERTGGWFRTARAPSSDPPPPPPLPYSDDEDSDEELELTQSQILQFEDENKALLRDAEDALATVQQAESRLMDISALQMELVQHLTQQAEITDQLFEDAVQASQTVNAANAQLVQARQRQSDSRLYILVFLLGASAALLFLHNY
jgi:syntaxin 18